MCIVSNWVNEAQDFIAVKKYDDLPNSLIPNTHCWFPEYSTVLYSTTWYSMVLYDTVQHCMLQYGTVWYR